MYCFTAEDVKFELIFVKCFDEEYKNGNPYNTFININIYSYGFFGTSQWTVDFDDLKEFAYKLKKMYDNLKGVLEFSDKDYGSNIRIECDGLGHFIFKGKLVGCTLQKLEFDFTVDQTYLKRFVDNLYADFVK